MSSKLSFLDLPPAVRAQIFEHAGLVRSCPVSPSQERLRLAMRGTHPTSMEWRGIRSYIMRRTPRRCPNTPLETETNGDDIEFGCCHGALQVSILRINRQVYLEAYQLLYSKNEFYFDCGDTYAMELFRNFSPRTMATLRKLDVSYDDHRHSTDIMYSVKAATHSLQPNFLVLRSAWMNLCQRLRDYQETDQLSLAFTCQVLNETTARELLECLKQVPRLRALRVDLGHCRSSQQRSKTMTLLQHTLQALTASPSPPFDNLGSSKFPFERLPFEIRSKVLMYAGLQRRKALTFSRTGLPAEVKHHNWRIDNCCDSCGGGYTQCYCSPPKRSKFREMAKISTACTCAGLRFPNSLFLVSKQMRAEALAILYSKNRFFVAGSLDETVEELDRATQHWLRRIRDLEIEVFDFFDENDLISRQWWANLLTVIAARCHPKIWLKIRPSHVDDRDHSRVGNHGLVELIKVTQKTRPEHVPSKVSVVVYQEAEDWTRGTFVTIFGPRSNWPVQF